MKMAVFPADGDEMVVHGALVQGEHHVPGAAGPLVYLNAGDDLSAPLARVEGAGGKIVQPRTAIGPHGFMAIFLDTEGNRLALHSMQ
jgi:predicted enzyme related to lactoylglutathione lyase